MSNNYIVTTAISKDPLTPSTWTSITNEITTLLQKAFQSTENAKTQLLDAKSSTDTDKETTARILELTLPLPASGSPPSLQQCTQSANDLKSQLNTQHDLCISVQPSALYTSHGQPGLIVFDMDSTLIQQEVIDELARSIGLYDKVAAITEAAMRGEAPYTDFSASLRARVALLKGVETSIWKKLREEVITFTPGGKELVKVLKSKGWKSAVLSGGFTPLAEWVKSELGLDYAEANHLEEEVGVLTGKLVEGKEIVNAERKRERLRYLAEKEGIEVGRTVAVGDGSNDLLMMHAAGLGIAFNAKPKVQAQAPAVLNSESLLDVSYFLGLTKQDIDAALN